MQLKPQLEYEEEIFNPVFAYDGIRLPVHRLL